MSTQAPTDLQQFRDFIDEKLATGSHLSPEETLRLYRNTQLPSALDEVIEYQSVPPKQTVLKPVTFRFVGKAKPLPYELDEDALELDENQ